MLRSASDVARRREPSGLVAEGMLDGVVAPDADVLTAVLAEVDRLRRLAGDLSTLSHADEGRLAIADALVDLHDAAATVVESFRPRALEKYIELQITDVGATVRGDRDRLIQVLTNLVANTLTYTPPHGYVTVDVAAQGQSAIVTVSDTGVGLAAADVERDFERFYRVHAVERPPTGPPLVGTASTTASASCSSCPDARPSRSTRPPSRSPCRRPACPGAARRRHLVRRRPHGPDGASGEGPGLLTHDHACRLSNANLSTHVERGRAWECHWPGRPAARATRHLVDERTVRRDGTRVRGIAIVTGAARPLSRFGIVCRASDYGRRRCRVDRRCIAFSISTAMSTAGASSATTASWAALRASVSKTP